MRQLFLFCFLLLPKLLFAEDIEVIIYNAPPYIIETDGQFSGITIRAIEAAFEEVGLKAKFVFYPYPRSIAVCAANANCVWVGSFEGFGDRIKGTLYQVSFIKYSTSFFYNHRTHPEFESSKFKDDFTGKKIGILRSEFNDLKSFEMQGAEIVQLSSHKALFQMIQSDRIDFAHYVELIAQIEVAAANGNDIRRIQETLISSQGGLLFKNKELAEKLHKSFSKLNSEGRLLKIFETELGKDSNIDLTKSVLNNITISSKKMTHKN